jgi:hypothetical protein
MSSVHDAQSMAERVLVSKHATSDEIDLARHVLDLLKRNLRRPPGHLCSSGLMSPCRVCEKDTSAKRVAYAPSASTWAFVPTNLELLYICLNCGNVIRERRLE